MNLRGSYAIFKNELMRAFRTIFGSILAPVITTSLYFIVFGAAIGGRISQINGVAYGAFIVPGLLMLTLLSESTSNASFGIYMPKFTGAIYELLSAPVGTLETLIGFVGAAAAKSLILAAIILATATLFVDYHIAHPLLAVLYIMLVSAAFSLFGFILGLWGGRVREAADRAAAHPHAAHLPGRHLLLDRHAGRAVALGRHGQSHRLPGERPALDFHRRLRLPDRALAGHDARLPGAVRRDHLGNLQDGVAAARLIG